MPIGISPEANQCLARLLWIADGQISPLQDESNKHMRDLSPVGATDFSPALQRWVKCKKDSSPGGTTEFSGALLRGGRAARAAFHSTYSWLILAKNSLLVVALASRSISNSIASTGDSGFNTLRSTQMRCKSSFGISSSSLRVPER
jgi:hypothetical protein